jgi:hypothetical protein
MTFLWVTILRINKPWLSIIRSFLVSGGMTKKVDIDALYLENIKFKDLGDFFHKVTLLAPRFFISRRY